ncbi:MAG TPA: PAS domain S-box protein [Aquabacterium sp.]|uniref:PAS domain S-box protein n=1 Tax=Aquabacterium sp. TaxID=1872578 RepID=UPI002E3049DA|nr:PAS domain S-box protein [Aquabacterium sp.]HEX5354730.1 PAS domain S-box protein [Aquabacterium sp.]
MSEGAVNDDLPEAVNLVLTRLEKLTGHMPMARVVVLILTTGLLLTSAVMGAVWWADQYRTRQAFDAASSRLQVMMQERLGNRIAMATQVSEWASSSSPLLSGGKNTVWTSNGLTLMDAHGAVPERLAQRLAIHPQQSQDLATCMARMPIDRSIQLCDVSRHADEAVQWFVVERVRARSGGWVLLPVDNSNMAMQLDDGMFWQVRARLLQVDRHASIDDAALRFIDIDVPGTQAHLPVELSGVARPQTLMDSWARQTSMWVAGSAGVLFTLAALHVYLMLISTRRRAGAMAREMSAALQHTQSRNQAVMDTAPDAIIMTDGAGHVRWCNQATTSLFGRTLQELAGQPIGSILPVIGARDVDAWFARHGFSNRVIGFETTGLRAEGTAFPVALSASRVQLDDEPILTFIARDTTDAKWAEQELSLRDRALASSADGVIITSMTLPRQPVIYVNHAFERITGYEAHEVLGLNCKILQRDDVDQPAVQIMREAIRKGESCKVVVRNYRKDGSLFYNDLAISPVLSPEGVLTHYVGVQTDITDRIAAEQVLHLRTERLNAVFDLSPDGFVVLDKRGEVSIVNPAFERMTGMLAGDMVGQSRDAFEEALMARCKSSELDDASTVAPLAGHEAEADGASRASRQLLHLHTPAVRTLVRRVRQGAHDNETVMYFRDITHELEVDRMKSEFLAMAAHELRTPMVSIFGFTELLLKRNFNDERRQDMLSTIHKQASILINLVNELLDLARIEARRGKDFKRQLQPIGPIIEQVLEGLKVPGDRRKVRVHMASPQCLVWADTDKLGQAVLNVLSNAYKYSPNGGEIHLHVKQYPDSAQLVIEVEDHGIGMTPAQLARVFERFFRADPSGNIPGTGLGMSLVKEIVSLHQGEVDVRSESGQGTTVRITLPAHMDGATQPPETRGVEDDTKVSTG